MAHKLMNIMNTWKEAAGRWCQQEMFKRWTLNWIQFGRKLIEEVKNLKQSLESAQEEIWSLEASQNETSAQVKQNNDIDFLYDVGALYGFPLGASPQRD